MRLLFIGLCICSVGLAQGGARAADGTATDVLGFSPDGRYFAFEQYGENSGSGILTAEIAVIEVASDRFVQGTPVKAEWNPNIDDAEPNSGQRTVAAVRRDAAAKAAPTLRKFAIGEKGVRIAAVAQSRPRDLLNQPEIDPTREAATTAVDLDTAAFGAGARIILRNIEFDLPRCKDLMREGKPKGFALTLERRGKPPLLLSADRSVPGSRGCPSRYGIAEVYATPIQGGGTALAVLIQYFFLAFEGDDRRFLAVTSPVR